MSLGFAKTRREGSPLVTEPSVGARVVTVSAYGSRTGVVVALSDNPRKGNPIKVLIDGEGVEVDLPESAVTVIP